MRKFVGLLAAALLAACVHSGVTAIDSGERYSASANTLESYRLGAGDKVRVNVYNEVTLSGEYTVGSDGTISLPLIGNVPAKDKTPLELAQTAQAMLADGFLRDPKVSIDVLAYRPFFILGEVKAPGSYPYTAGLTVWNAIATAEGLTPRARKKSVMIRRFGEKDEAEYVLTPALRVMPGDTIRLAERYF